MAKSVLGDDPFAQGSAKPARSKPAQSTAGNKSAGKQAAGKQAAAKKTSSAKGTRSTRRSAPPDKRTREKDARPEAAGQPPRAHSPMIDGATARRAAHATASLGEPPPLAQPAPRAGPGIDPQSMARPAPGGSLIEEFRRIERHVTTRPHGDIASPAERSPSLLDRVGEMLRPETYRNRLSGWMMRDRSDVVDGFGLDPVYAEKWRPLLEFLYHSYFRVEAVGMEHLPDHGRALIVSNHSGTLPLDGAMIMYAVRFCHPAHRDIRPLVEDFVFHFPYLGVAMNRIGCVRACQENAERLLESDQVIAVFPEGIKGIGKRYSKRYQLQRFGRGGFIKLALRSQAPIIPAAVIGAEEIYPMLTKVTWLAKYLGIPYVPITPTFPWLGPIGALPIPTKWTIRFGEPIDIAGRHGQDAYQDRILVNKLTETIRSTIQAMVDDTLSSRRSIIFG